MGIVEELGPGTSGRLSKGQRVVAGDWGLTSWQEYAAIEEKYLVRRCATPTSTCNPDLLTASSELGAAIVILRKHRGRIPVRLIPAGSTCVHFCRKSVHFCSR